MIKVFEPFRSKIQLHIGEEFLQSLWDRYVPVSSDVYGQISLIHLHAGENQTDAYGQPVQKTINLAVKNIITWMDIRQNPVLVSHSAVNGSIQTSIRYCLEQLKRSDRSMYRFLERQVFRLEKEEREELRYREWERETRTIETWRQECRLLEQVFLQMQTAEQKLAERNERQDIKDLFLGMSGAEYKCIAKVFSGWESERRELILSQEDAVPPAEHSLTKLPRKRKQLIYWLNASDAQDIRSFRERMTEIVPELCRAEESRLAALREAAAAEQPEDRGAQSPETGHQRTQEEVAEKQPEDGSAQSPETGHQRTQEEVVEKQPEERDTQSPETEHLRRQEEIVQTCRRFLEQLSAVRLQREHDVREEAYRLALAGRNSQDSNDYEINTDIRRSLSQPGDIRLNLEQRIAVLRERIREKEKNISKKYRDIPGGAATGYLRDIDTGKEHPDTGEEYPSDFWIGMPDTEEILADRAGNAPVEDYKEGMIREWGNVLLTYSENRVSTAVREDGSDVVSAVLPDTDSPETRTDRTQQPALADTDSPETRTDRTQQPALADTDSPETRTDRTQQPTLADTDSPETRTDRTQQLVLPDTDSPETRTNRIQQPALPDRQPELMEDWSQLQDLEKQINEQIRRQIEEKDEERVNGQAREANSEQYSERINKQSRELTSSKIREQISEQNRELTERQINEQVSRQTNGQAAEEFRAQLNAQVSRQGDQEEFRLTIGNSILQDSSVLRMMRHINTLNEEEYSQFVRRLS
ncbi:MAG: hypothetical protein LIO75_05880, partial [Lachnospiraceae bacterium]|nr:hypothetical protein [Lachnospiraceae bacterium]